MSSFKRNYRELIELTSAYILQEHGLDERIFASYDTFDYFRAAAKLKAQNAALNENQGAKKVTPSLVLGPLKQKELKQKTSEVSPKSSMQTPLPGDPRFNENNFNEVKITSNNISLKKSALEPKVEAQETKTAVDPQKIIINQDVLLEAIPPLKKWDLSEIRKNVLEHLPYIQIIDNIPQIFETRTTIQKTVQELSKVLILNLNEEKLHQKFLNNISDALCVHGIKVKVISNPKELKEASLKEKPLVIASNKSIHSYNNYFSECPLHLLFDIEIYFNEPSLKINLWKALKEYLKIS